MLWIHPRKPWLKLRRKVVAVVAVIQMGIRDHGRIASIVGIKPEEVARIDAADDPCIRELSLEGIPPGEFFAIARELRCAECGAKLTLVPCVTCQTHRVRHQLANSEQPPLGDADQHDHCDGATELPGHAGLENQISPTQVQ